MSPLPALPRCANSSPVSAPVRALSSSRYRKDARCVESGLRQRTRRAFPPQSSIVVAAAAESSSSSTSSSSSFSSARLRTLDGCGLRISIYPPFSYNASGGGALVGTLSEGKGGGGGGGGGGGTTAARRRNEISFAPSSISIPDLDYKTTKFLGLPLPPGLRIQIEPLRLEGWVEERTGEVSLDFEARFRFTAFGLYRPPPLFVSTTLTTGEARGRSEEEEGEEKNSESGEGWSGRRGSGVKLAGRGQPLRPRREAVGGEGGETIGGGGGGSVALAGVAIVAPVGDAVLDSFLMLPTECLAELRAELEFF